MYDLLQMLAEDGLSISYRPALAKKLGSITAAILFRQILHHCKNKGYKPFWKFKEPCKHALYKEGDSWVEELGFSRREFDSALDHIAQKIRSGVEKIPTKLVWYWTDSNRVTHYELNMEACAMFVKGLYVTAESAVSKSANPPLLLTETSSETCSDIPLAETGVSAPAADLQPFASPLLKTAEDVLNQSKQQSAEERKKKVKLAFPTLEELEAQIDGWWQSWDLWKTTTLPRMNNSGEISHARLSTILADLLEKQNRYNLSADAMRHGFSAAIGKGVWNDNYVINTAKGYRA